MEHKKVHVPSMICAVVGLVFALLIPLVTYVFCGAGIAMINKQKMLFNTKPALIISIIALVIALINSVLGVLINTGAIALQ